MSVPCRKKERKAKKKKCRYILYIYIYERKEIERATQPMQASYMHSLNERTLRAGQARLHFYTHSQKQRHFKKYVMYYQLFKSFRRATQLNVRIPVPATHTHTYIYIYIFFSSSRVNTQLCGSCSALSSLLSPLSPPPLAVLKLKQLWSSGHASFGRRVDI